MQSSAGCPVLLGQETLGSKGSCPVRGTQTCNFMMDMNHVPLTLWQYLWAAHCIALPAFALVVLGSKSKPLSDLWFDFPFLSVVWLLALAGRSRTARHGVSFFNMQSSGHELAPFLSQVSGWCQIQLARLLSFCGLLPEASEEKVRRMLLG